MGGGKRMTTDPTALDDPAETDEFGDPATPDPQAGDKPYPALLVRGRYDLTDPETGKKKKYSRVSTIAKTIANTYFLDLWGDRMIVKGMATRPDLVTLAGAVDLEDKETLQDIAEQAKTAAGARKGANHGTALHALAERADHGLELPPGTHKTNVAGIETYREAMEAAGCRVVPGWVERVVLCQELEIVGRLDRVLEVDPVVLATALGISPAALGLDGPGLVYSIGDLKTQKTMDFGSLEIAMQLAIYAHGDITWNEWTGEWDEIQMDITKKWGVVMHLPSTGGKCHIKLVNLTKGWVYVQLAMAVRRARKDKTLLKDVLTMDTNPWTRAIMKATTKEGLSQIWRDADSRGEWNSQLEALGKQRLAGILSNNSKAIESGKDE
jgi:hypothetical protein